MRERCQVLATPQQMPSAFFGRYRLMAIDGTVFNAPETDANVLAFGRSSNQYGPGAYPQVRCVLLAECGSHGVVGLEMGRYEVSEVHGAHRLLEQVGPDMLVMGDAGIISGGFVEHVRRDTPRCWGHWKQGCGNTWTTSADSLMGRCWHGCPQRAKAKRSILSIGGCGCASSPIASPMSA